MELHQDHVFSDLEVDQVRAVVREEFGFRSQWTVPNVNRRDREPEFMDVTVQNLQDQRSIQFELCHSEFEGDNPANSSQLTGTVFNISIRLMEFGGIRGFDEFEDGARFSLVIYPDTRRVEGPAQPDWIAMAPLRSEEC